MNSRLRDNISVVPEAPDSLVPGTGAEDPVRSDGSFLKNLDSGVVHWSRGTTAFKTVCGWHFIDRHVERPADLPANINGKLICDRCLPILRRVYAAEELELD